MTRLEELKAIRLGLLAEMEREAAIWCGRPVDEWPPYLPAAMEKLAEVRRLRLEIAEMEKTP